MNIETVVPEPVPTTYKLTLSASEFAVLQDLMFYTTTVPKAVGMESADMTLANNIRLFMMAFNRTHLRPFKEFGAPTTENT